MLTPSKRKKLLGNLKSFQKKYFNKSLGDLDESGTRLMVNDLLTEVLGYKPIEEIKTEYMIRGTYADYMVQIKGNRHFLVEVKALTLSLSDKHLRQVISYGANEGVDYAVLTNGREVQLHRIIFGKPIDSKLIFSVDITSKENSKLAVEKLQFLHRDAVTKKGLDKLWNRFIALEIYTIAGILFDNSIINIIRRALKRKFKNKFEKEEIKDSLSRVICLEMDMMKVHPASGPRKGKRRGTAKATIEVKDSGVELPSMSSSLN
jgi:predicted type IV restriction endonuclease